MQKGSAGNLVGSILKNYKVKGVVGSGAFATVYEAKDIKTQQLVAIKAIPIELIKKQKKLKQLVQTEIRVLKSCSNENVIRHVTSFKSDKNVFIVTQFCQDGDVQTYLNSKKVLPEQEALDFLRQILNGFKGLHEIRAMHRDFKLSNLLIKNKQIKIADLGFAKQLQKQDSVAKTQLGTRYTMAPQILDGLQYGMVADIWSIGVVFYQMLFGIYPFLGSSDLEIRKKIRIRNIKYSSNSNVNVKISQNAKDFIQRCLIIDPSLRISWGQIYDHPLLKSSQKLNGSISKIKFQENKEYYKKHQIQPHKQFIYPQKQQFITQGYQIKETVSELQGKDQSNVQSYIKQQSKLREKKKNQNEIAEIQEILLKKRDSLKFMYTYFVPKISPFIELFTANHSIHLFFICKSIVIQLQDFVNQLNQKRSNQNSTLKAFFKSKNSELLINLLLEDIDSIKDESAMYKFSIQNPSPQVQCQLEDITKWSQKNWKQAYDQLLKRYWFQIAENIFLDPSQDHKEILWILKALQYYLSTSKQDLQIDVFQMILETLDYKQFEEQINRTVFQDISG